MRTQLHIICTMGTHEEWQVVPGLPHVEVTRNGRVRTAAYSVTRRSRWGNDQTYNFPAREITPRLHDNGYMRCSVQRDTKRGPLYVHRLVARTFVTGYMDGFHVNHINGVKTDNRPENLEWVPVEENTRHAWRTGLVDLRGEKSPSAVLTAPKVRAIRRALAAGVNTSTLSVIAGVSRATIKAIQDGASWTSVQG